MGGQCSGQQAYCCNGNDQQRDSEVNQQLGYTRTNPYIKGLHRYYENFSSVHLQGTRGVPTRAYSSEDIRKVVHLQACARRFLAQRLIKNVIENPTMYLQPSYMRDSARNLQSYKSEIVVAKIKQLGEFQWTDQVSEQILQASGMQSEANIEDGKYEEITLPSKVRYMGEWNQYSERHGRGTQIWPDGARFDGYFIRDRQEGYGRIIHADGDTYLGYWKDDKSNGKGRYTHVDGAFYDGNWLEDKHHGFGKEVWADGAVFQGEYRQGKKHGRGRFIWPDGSTFDGDFISNKMEGRGVYQWIDGRKYDGEWQNNQQHGQGSFYWIDGREYHGGYVCDKREGQGVFTWPDGRKYEGGWLEGRQHGIAHYTKNNGKVKKGIWENGKRQGAWLSAEAPDKAN